MLLLSSKEAPHYMREDAITSGYRQKLSYKACLISWFRLHNETVNIWTHLIGFLIFVYCLLLAIFQPPREIHSLYELFPIVIQLLSYMACMLSSALFHTFSCHSEEVHRSWRYTDHFGILFALFGTYVSLICNTFACFPPWKEVHLSVVITLFIWVVSVKINRNGDCRIPLDIFIYVTLYSAIPIAHWTWLQGGMTSPVVLEKLKQIVLPFVAGGTGLGFYLSRFPEKLFKSGTVDIWGASHQFWHVLIFLGMACWYQETTISFAEEQTSQCSTTKGFNASTHQIINWIQGQFNQSFPSVMKEVNQEF